MLNRLRDAFLDFRNRRIADPGFRRWAGRFPLTRPIARRQAGRLFDLAAGFVYSQVLSAFVKSGLVELLADGPQPIERIADRTGHDLPAAARLLKAAAALGLAEQRRGGRFVLGPLGAALVGNDGALAMILHHDVLYGDLADPLELLAGRRSGRLGTFWAYGDEPADAPPAAHAAYSALMSASQALVATEILDAWPLRGYRRLLDIGCGDGTFLMEAARRAPHIELRGADLAPVAAIARSKIETEGLGERTEIVAADFLRDILPSGADLAVLNRILHDHDDPVAETILRAARGCLVPGGTVLVAEPMSGTAGAEASGDAYFGFYLLAMGRGRPRTAREYRAMLRRAGFEGAREIATNNPLIARLVTARVPRTNLSAPS